MFSEPSLNFVGELLSQYRQKRSQWKLKDDAYLSNRSGQRLRLIGTAFDMQRRLGMSSFRWRYRSADHAGLLTHASLHTLLVFT